MRSDGAGVGGEKRPAAPKGQWERRLQTDIHTARQALRDALSLEPSTPAKEAPPLPTTPAGSATYASSAENIARLLEGWMRPGGGKGPEASGSTSTTGTTTQQQQRPQCSGEGGAASASASQASGGGAAAAAAQTPECSTETSKMAGAGAGAPPAFSMLESWLLDDGMGHGEVGLIDVVPLGDPSEFF
ncbi:hypothetical protein EJB05_43008, partial [Eragrostis curvula]